MSEPARDPSKGQVPAQAPQSPAKLVFRSGPLRGNVLAVEKDRLTIGRDPRNDIAIKDGIISSFHAAIVHETDGTYWLEDVSSKNGTFLGGERIDRVELKEGDVFFLCQSGPELQFTLGDPSLPSVLESTTATYARTKSITKALRELLPHGRSGLEALLSLTGVRRILDYGLEETTRRARLRWLGAIVVLFAASALTLLGLIYGELRDGRPDAPQGGGPAAIRAGGERGGPAGGDSPAALDAEASRRGVKLVAKLEPIYGSLFLMYRESPIGVVEVHNTGKVPIPGCELGLRFDGTRFLVEPFVASVPELAPGEVQRVLLTPKLSKEVLLDQSLEVTATIFAKRGEESLAEISCAIFVIGRHAFNWEKPERIAVFVDQNDPAIQAFVQDVWTRRPPMSPHEFPPPNVTGAVTLLSGLAAMGLQYLPDARNPLSERIDSKALDTIHYAGETLLARKGDCDDLSVLCCAVLEAAGIPAALAVGAGHVLFLLDTGMSAASIDDTPFNPDTIVVRGGKIWMPIEATDFARPGANFASAWSAGWPRCRVLTSGEMQIIELRDAWQRYQPMTMPPEEKARKQIDGAPWAKNDLGPFISFGLEALKKLFLNNLAHRVEELDRTEEPGPAREQAVALLYAKVGLFDDARRVLESAIFAGEGAPSLEGLSAWAGRLTDELVILLSDLAVCLTVGARSAADLDRAAGYLELAVGGLPDAAAREKGELMLRLALVHRQRGALPEERSWSEKAFALDPSLRSTYEGLLAAGGAMAGPEEKVIEFLKKGLR